MKILNTIHLGLILIVIAIAGCGQPAAEKARVDGDEAVDDAEKIGEPAVDEKETPTGVEQLPAPVLDPPVAEEAAKIKSRGDGVFVKDDLVFRGASAGLVIGAMQDGGKKLTDRGVLYLPDAGSDVVVVGETAFVASGPQGVVVVDVSDPSAPSAVTRLATGGAALRFSLDGDRLLVANASGGVVLLDVSKPGSPAVVARWQSEGYVRHAILLGDDVYVAEGKLGVSRLELKGSTLEHVWRLDTPGQARAVSLHGDKLAVADGPRGVMMLDVSKRDKPQVLGSMDLADMARDILVSSSGERAFVASGDDGIIMVDISSPSKPVKAGEFVPDKPTNRLRARGETLYVGNDSAGLLVLDVKNPDEPAQVYPPAG